MLGTLRSLVRRARPALRSARRSPVLFVAARRAGANPWTALRILHLTGLALTLTPTRAAGAPGRVNAVRHFAWQAGLAARFGEDVAVALADAQEEGALDAADSAVDLRNNAAGRAHGRAHADRLDGNAWSVMTKLIREGVEAWNAGELAAV